MYGVFILHTNICFIHFYHNAIPTGFLLFFTILHCSFFYHNAIPTGFLLFFMILHCLFFYHNAIPTGFRLFIFHQSIIQFKQKFHPFRIAHKLCFAVTIVNGFVQNAVRCR